MWRYHKKAQSIITVNGSRKLLLTPGRIKDYEIRVTDSQLYTKMLSLTQRELLIADSEKSAAKEGDSGSEPEVESGYDEVVLAEIK